MRSLAQAGSRYSVPALSFRCRKSWWILQRGVWQRLNVTFSRITTPTSQWLQYTYWIRRARMIAWGCNWNRLLSWPVCSQGLFESISSAPIGRANREGWVSRLTSFYTKWLCSTNSITCSSYPRPEMLDHVTHKHNSMGSHRNRKLIMVWLLKVGVLQLTMINECIIGWLIKI